MQYDLSELERVTLKKIYSLWARILHRAPSPPPAPS